MLPHYTYVEPEFDADIGSIYLAKEDSVQSEQTFSIIVQFTDTVPSGRVNINPATIGYDYGQNFCYGLSFNYPKGKYPTQFVF